MSPDVSVVISTYNPDHGRLKRTLQGVMRQTLPSEQWELVVVDNASTIPLKMANLGLSAGRNITLTSEERLGLAYGRLAGVNRSGGSILVFVDDDNVIAPDYLQNSLSIFRRLPHVGLGGGKCVPEWECAAPEPWVTESYGNLALRDLGDEEQLASMTTPPVYPLCAPIGAGMIARREAIRSWLNECVTEGAPTGRRGKELTSGEDCDIVMSVLRDGWQVGYFPELTLTHLIPSSRVTREYLGSLNYGIAKSWVQVLARHGIYPWPRAARWSVPYRKARAYFRYRAWAGQAEYVRWRGACGQFDGRAAIY
jgi:glycosyltransferase involved in cell wall biosynthesis